VKYLISSTFHGNYSLGNVRYPDVIRIGHEDYKTDLVDMMQTDKMPAAQQAAMLPHETFRDRMSIFLGGKEIRILHLGRRAHTRRQRRLRAAGPHRLFERGVLRRPVPVHELGLRRLDATIDAALKLDADIFVPGQGPSMIASNPRASREALMRARAVLVNFRDGVSAQIARGATEIRPPPRYFCRNIRTWWAISSSARFWCAACTRT
jgi:hypothetical protein